MTAESAERCVNYGLVQWREGILGGICHVLEKPCNNNSCKDWGCIALEPAERGVNIRYTA
jgi:hypothetical protein